MITGELKNRIDSIWEIFWTGGLTNPLDVIEQMTYLMIIHDLDTADTLRAKESAMLGLPFESIFAEEVQIGNQTVDGTQLKWSIFHDFPAADCVQDFMMAVQPEFQGHVEMADLFQRFCDDADAVTEISDSETSTVHVDTLNDSEISSYIATGEPFDKAGAYGIQGVFARYIERIDGDYNNVVGLPVYYVSHQLKKIRADIGEQE